MLVQVEPCCVWSKVYVPDVVYDVPFHEYSSHAVTEYEESSWWEIVRSRVSELGQPSLFE